jgi:anti-sigma regulatory factor (Ser/Thr protein kinase)
VAADWPLDFLAACGAVPFYSSDDRPGPEAGIEAPFLALGSHSFPVEQGAVSMHSQGFVVHFTIRSRPHLVAAVRRRVMVQLHCRGVRLEPDVAAVLELLVSELVTNAVVHAGGPLVTVALYGWGDRTLVDVHDTSTQLPQVRRTQEMAEAGRGLQLIALLAHSYGWALTRTGKHCWVEVRHSAAPVRSTVPPTHEATRDEVGPGGGDPDLATVSGMPELPGEQRSGWGAVVEV